jgi:hypothetical protein
MRIFCHVRVGNLAEWGADLFVRHGEDQRVVRGERLAEHGELWPERGGGRGKHLSPWDDKEPLPDGHGLGCNHTTACGTSDQTQTNPNPQHSQDQNIELAMAALKSPTVVGARSRTPPYVSTPSRAIACRDCSLIMRLINDRFDESLGAELGGLDFERT